MELNLRTVLVILGAIVMLGILVDGFRRMRRARFDALKLDVKGDFKFPEESFSSELPNGGARIIGGREDLLEDVTKFRNQLDELPVMSALEELEKQADYDLAADVKVSLHEDRIYAGEPDFQHDSYSQAEPEAIRPAEHVLEPTNVKGELPERFVPKAKPLNLDEHVPLLIDVEELGDDVDVHAVDEKNGEVEHIELTVDDIVGIQASVQDIGSLMSPVETVVEEPVVEEEAIVEERIAVEKALRSKDDGRMGADQMMAQAAYAPVKKPGLNAESLSSRNIPSLVIVTHVVSHDEDGFCGEDILYLVNSCDLRHGEKEIFHRFEQENGEGCVQFSMANSFNPGIFDPVALLHQRIQGVSLFMSLPGPKKAMDAFEAMTEMASVIARNLGGDVHDETHSIMALQTIEHNRQQVRDFVRKQKLAGKK
jgi:cell division protein ZipA